MSGYELFGEDIIDFKYILLDINRYSKEELLKASNIISTVFLIERKKNDIESLVEVLKEAFNSLRCIEPKQFELLRNWFINIVIIIWMRIKQIISFSHHAHKNDNI